MGRECGVCELGTECGVCEVGRECGVCEVGKECGVCEVGSSRLGSRTYIYMSTPSSDRDTNGKMG